MDQEFALKLATAIVGTAVLNGFTAWLGAKKANKNADRELLTVSGENGSSTLRKAIFRIDERLEGAEARIDKRFNNVDKNVEELRGEVKGIEGRVTKLESKPKRSRKSV